MATTMTQQQILQELEPTAERLMDRHISMFKDWNPHDYIPWSDGRTSTRSAARIGTPGSAKLSDVARWRWCRTC